MLAWAWQMCYTLVYHMMDERGGVWTAMRYETRCAQETFALGERLGRAARPGQIYALTGELGVGKTVFTQGLASGLGIEEPVRSPTFTILQVYEEGHLPFYHFDVYRIADVDEMDEIGYEDCFYGQGVCLVEWADLIGEILPPEAIPVTIEKDLAGGGPDYRMITIGLPEGEDGIERVGGI